MSQLNDLAELYRGGFATKHDFEGVKPEDIVAIKTEQAPRRRFVAEKAHVTDAETGVVTGVPISTEDVDRVGDVIKQAGWETSNYKRNPVVLLQHDAHCSLPIAIGKKLRRGQSATGKRALLGDEHYHDDDMLEPRHQLAKRHVMAGSLPGRSVGFIPLDGKYASSDEEAEELGVSPGGILITKAELLEWSVVPIPCNQHTLQERTIKTFRDVQKRAAEDFPAELLREFEARFPLTEEDFRKRAKAERRSFVSLAGLKNEDPLEGNDLPSEPVTEPESAPEPVVEPELAAEPESEPEDVVVTETEPEPVTEPAGGEMPVETKFLAALKELTEELQSLREILTNKVTVTDVAARSADADEKPSGHTGLDNDTVNYFASVEKDLEERLNKAFGTCN